MPAFRLFGRHPGRARALVTREGAPGRSDHGAGPSRRIGGAAWAVIPVGCLLVAGLTGCSGGCSGTSEAERQRLAAEAEAERQRAAARQAIAEAYAADQRLHAAMEALPADAPPSHYADVVRAYCDALDRRDWSGCPADFQAAYRRHVRAWRDLETAARQLPDGFLSGAAQGTVNLLTRGEWDGGARRMTAQAEAARRQVRATWEDVERIGAQHGVPPPPLPPGGP